MSSHTGHHEEEISCSQVRINAVGLETKIKLLQEVMFAKKAEKNRHKPIVNVYLLPLGGGGLGGSEVK